MRWASAKNIAELIINDRLDEIKNLLEVHSPETLRYIISQKYQHSSLLFIAVKYRRVSIVEYLLRVCKADPDDEGIYNAGTCPCLWLAAAQHDLESVALLLKYGAFIDCIDVYCRTALYVASYGNAFAVVKYLIANGADVNEVDYKGTTCLMVAIDNHLICSFLIDNGADVNQVDNDGKTALMYAVESKNICSVSMLMSREADFKFQNNYGESAAFIAAMENRLDIVAAFKAKGLQSVDAILAEVYEIRCCRRIINKDVTETLLLWKEAVHLRNLPIYTPLFQITKPLVVLDRLSWINNYFDQITGSAILFLISQMGFFNPYTLTILREAICQVQDVVIFVILHRLFMRSLLLADNSLFERAFMNVYLMLSRFLQEWGSNFDAIKCVFGVFVEQIENFFDRIQSSSSETRGETLPLVFQIKSYLKLFIDILRKIHFNFPMRIDEFTDAIRIVVTADNCGPHKFSLLHMCIENEYPIILTRFLLQCGANVMRTDEKGNSPVHYALQSSTYRTEETTKMFIEYGFQPEKFKDELCLSCSLRRNGLLQHPVKYVTLRCLAAEMVLKKQLPYEDRLPISYQNIIYSHF